MGNGTAICAYIGVVLGVNVGIYGKYMAYVECLGILCTT